MRISIGIIDESLIDCFFAVLIYSEKLFQKSIELLETCNNSITSIKVLFKKIMGFVKSYLGFFADSHKTIEKKPKNVTKLESMLGTMLRARLFQIVDSMTF